MELRFGTDGVRGRAYDELTLDGAARIGRAVARTFGPRVLIGADTRASGPDLVGALAAGIAAAGGDTPVWLGVAPTPAVAFTGAHQDLPAIVVSASHNVWSDNGIKVFAPGGIKLSDDQQRDIEADLVAGEPVASVPVSLDSFDDGQPMLARWQAALGATVAPGALGGLRVVLDPANGAASGLAGPILANAGAYVDVINAEPTGRNINDRCGSTHPESLAAQVVAGHADVGIALDGDADRMVAVDHTGAVLDGDAVIALLAQRQANMGRLADNTVVVTVMTNLGFDRAMSDAGIATERVAVGDRHVFAALQANQWSLGGEQSGHIIFRDHATTGDGTLSALQLLDLVATSGERLHDLATTVMTPMPQVLTNVAVSAPASDVTVAMAAEIAAAEDELGRDGRVLVRASGTEPVVRVMVEALDEGTAQGLCARLSAVVAERFAP